MPKLQLISNLIFENGKSYRILTTKYIVEPKIFSIFVILHKDGKKSICKRGSWYFAESSLETPSVEKGIRTSKTSKVICKAVTALDLLNSSRNGLDYILVLHILDALQHGPFSLCL